VNDDVLSAEIEPQAKESARAALALQRRGFRILHSGPTISVEGPRALWESAFDISFTSRKQPVSALTGKKQTYLEPKSDPIPIPTEWQPVIASIAFVRPPELFGGMM